MSPDPKGRRASSIVHTDAGPLAVGPGGDAPRHVAPRRIRAVVFTAAVLVAAGAWLSGFLDAVDGPGPSSVVVPAPIDPVPVSPTIAPSSVPRSAGAGPVPAFPGPGVNRLEGVIAVAPLPGSAAPVPLTVVEPGPSTFTAQVPLRSGDFPFPIVITSGHVVFTDRRVVYVGDGDLGTPPRRVSRGAIVIPTGDPGLVWVIGADGLVARLDVTSGVLGEAHDVESVFTHPQAGVAGGLIVEPVDYQRFGRLAYWSPETGLRRIEALEKPWSRLLAAGGDIAVFVADSTEVQVVDVAADVLVTRMPMDFLVASPHGCLSPDAQALIVPTRTGGAVIDLSSGDVLTTFQLDYPYHGVAWTGPDQFVYVAYIDGRQSVWAGSVGETHVPVAVVELPLQGTWWLAAEGSTC